MKRSHVPSQVRIKEERERSRSSSSGKDVSVDVNGGGAKEGAESQTIQVLPLFEFLSIPNNLQKQFTVPTGCKITKQSIEMRKTKVLGGGYHKTPMIQIGDLKAFVPVGGLVMASGEEVSLQF